jgi:hypothetical protein
MHHPDVMRIALQKAIERHPDVSAYYFGIFRTHRDTVATADAAAEAIDIQVFMALLQKAENALFKRFAHWYAS